MVLLNRFDDASNTKAGAPKAGERARRALLEAAGAVFAESGYQGATSREICERAGVNSAAVNYHFGGIEALYVATLIEADRRAMWGSTFEVDGFAQLPARAKLSALIRKIVGQLAQTGTQSWETRLISREMFIPTFAQEEFVATSIEPRRAYFRSLIGEILGRSPDDAVVGRCLLTVIAPWIMMATINRKNLHVMVPDLQTDGITPLQDHVDCFIMAGLDAVPRDQEMPC